MKIRMIFSVAFFVSTFAIAQLEPSYEKYSPTKLEWLLLQMKLRSLQFPDEHKPYCFTRESNTIDCLGMLNSKKRNELIKTILREEFNEVVKTLGLSGKVKLTFNGYP